MKKGDIETALTCFQKAVETNRLDVTVCHCLGQIYHSMGKIEKATEFFARVPLRKQ
jgi:Tfp pilus assembly protein PilF